MNKSFKLTKFACYYTNLAISEVFCLPPILFLTFREMYGLSFTMLGSLVVMNFCTQLAIDLVYSFFGKHINPHLSLRITPLLTGLGLIIYALVPTFFPNHAYLGLLAGTFVFSLSAGMSEVLVSPTIAAIPSNTPDKDMAALHSVYGYGLVIVIFLSTVFLQIFGQENWAYLVLLWTIPPITASIILFKSPMPKMNLSHEHDKKSASKRNTGIILCMLCIFFGSCAENSMTNWVSGYIEMTLNIPKAVGDIFGLMLFAALLALTRTWYAKYGKNIYKVLLASMIGAVICYVVASLSPIPIISMIACVLTGITTSMLWPGTLIFMEEKISNVGVTSYALLAAGGDFGASVAPQLIGFITDKVAESEWGIAKGIEASITPEQLGIKIGVLTAAIFPLIGTVVLLYMKKYFNKQELKR